MLDFNTWSAVLSSFLLWIIAYFLLKWIQSNHRSEWICRELTVIHACLISAMSGYSMLTEQSPLTDLGKPNTPLQTLVVTISLAYFIFDLLWCVIHQTEGVTMLVHHVASLVGMSVMLHRDMYGAEHMATLCGTELTNPLLQTRWFLKECGLGGTRLFVAVELLFLACFTCMRLGVGSPLLLFYLHSPQPDALGKFAACCIYGIGVAFWLMLVRYAIRKYFKRAHTPHVRSASSRGSGDAATLNRRTDGTMQRHTRINGHFGHKISSIATH